MEWRLSGGVNIEALFEWVFRLPPAPVEAQLLCRQDPSVASRCCPQECLTSPAGEGLCMNPLASSSLPFREISALLNVSTLKETLGVLKCVAPKCWRVRNIAHSHPSERKLSRCKVVVEHFIG